MYPEFEINGVKYTADRVFGRLGAVVRCKVMNEKDVEDASLPEERRRSMKLLGKLLTAAAVLGIMLLFSSGNPGRFPAIGFSGFISFCIYRIYLKAR